MQYAYTGTGLDGFPDTVKNNPEISFLIEEAETVAEKKPREKETQTLN